MSGCAVNPIVRLCLVAHNPLPFFFFNDTATPEIYTLSLHDALPIYHGTRTHRRAPGRRGGERRDREGGVASFATTTPDRKSTRLNSSHVRISYAVFFLKKKNTQLLPDFRDASITNQPSSCIATLTIP